MTISLSIYTACNRQEENKVEGKYILHPADYTTSHFLEKWNRETISAIEQEQSADNMYYQLLIDNLKKDTLGFPATTRGRFLSILEKNKVLHDSIQYNTIYIIETEHLGEYISYSKYLVIDGQPQDYYFMYESGVDPRWSLESAGRGDFSNVLEMFQYLASKKSKSAVKAQNVGPILITQVNPDTLFTKIVFSPTEEQMDSISAFAKYLYSFEKQGNKKNKSY